MSTKEKTKPPERKTAGPVSFMAHREEFLKAAALAGSVRGRSHLPILSCVLLRAVGDGITLIGSNLETSLRVWCAADVRKEGVVAVPAGILGDFLKTALGDEVEFQAEDGGRVTLKCGKSRCQLIGLFSEDYPVIPPFKTKDALVMDAAKFSEMLKRTAFAASTDNYRYVLCGVHMEHSGGVFKMVATDGKRMAIATQGGLPKLPERKATIPNEVIRHLQAVLKREQKKDAEMMFVLDSNLAVFKNDDVEVIGRVIEGNFVAYQNSAEKKAETTFKLNRALLASAVRSACIASGPNFQGLDLAVAAGVMTLSTKSDNGSVAQAEIAVPGEAEAKGRLNGAYLLEALDSLDTEEVLLGIPTGTATPLTLGIPSFDGYKSLIMGMNV